MKKFIYSDDSLRLQIENTPYKLGFYEVKFYSLKGVPTPDENGELSTYYFYPSGGTLRDTGFNIVLYNARFDTYRGYIPPHLKK
ncbi:MAG: hypothetical protein GX452_00310 [Ignavibacteriales bacterium]|jgi:hypothetical protein|nr:hypothetical protein [Ignavibacteriaceae bacterium]NLH59827.1 hypothetical protein [Ignavibacteriales bacterium]HOJ18340.1 hypothetical protein [Ignavibacteriaceae bacterium]HPO56750.1 hypothetical protein [Ignavibacteriaceae bacterium]